MKFVIQRVKHASVTVDGEVIGKIGRGYMVLIGVCDADDEAVADRMLDKMIKLRINEDAEGKTNLALADTGGGLLLVSQFTLYGDASHGNRPSFTLAARPEIAEPLYEYAVKTLQGLGVTVKKGVFGGDMQIEQHNDGPVTILLEKED